MEAEKDGKLVKVWQSSEKTSLEEEDTWLEELTLTEEERKLLMKLETNYHLKKEHRDEFKLVENMRAKKSTNMSSVSHGSGAESSMDNGNAGASSSIVGENVTSFPPHYSKEALFVLLSLFTSSFLCFDKMFSLWLLCTEYVD